jgi:diphthamide biosynthesis protein 4
MLHWKNSIQETYYDVLSVKEDASYVEIRTSYRSAILNYHPDKLQNTRQASDPEDESDDRFMKVQKAWEILGNSMSRAVYDSKLRALRQDTEVSEDISLEEMMVEDNGEIFEMFYQCQCGDYFSIDSSEFEKMGYTLSRDECHISIQKPDALPASVVLPCGSCSLQVRLLINADIKVPIGDNL